jgi:hypothetical protein
VAFRQWAASSSSSSLPPTPSSGTRICPVDSMGHDGRIGKNGYWKDKEEKKL